MKREEFVSVRLFGGLGNQIFQYMAGKWLAMDRKSLLYVDTSWLQDGYTHLNSSIAEFKFYKPDHEYGQEHKNLPYLYLDRFATIAARNFPAVAKLSKINAPRSAGFEDFSTVKLEVQLRGYYQSPRYFMELTRAGEITSESFELVQPHERFNWISSQVSDEGFLAVHVRGGDYLKKNSAYAQLPAEYYKTAIGFLNNACGNLPIWVFTDDEAQAKKILSSFSNLYFVDNKALTAAESMKLMSKARGIVCANSTFSYWASFFSNNHPSIVASRGWMKASNQSEDFFPKGWRLI